MITFKGITHRRGHSIYREVIDCEERDAKRLCAGRCAVVLHGFNDAYEDENRPIGWGYIGHGPDLLSVGLLGCVLRFKDQLDHRKTVLGLDPELDGSFNHTKEHDFNGWRTQVMQCYKDFTAQITSKLPDNWTITSDEILAWIDDHSKLPKAVTETSNNQRKHEREAEEKRTGSVTGRG